MKPTTSRPVQGAAIKIAASILRAGIPHAVWLGSFLIIAKLDSSMLGLVAWVTAAPATALGFALGAWTCERVTGEVGAQFASALCWPMVGCTIGALSVYRHGPMLIVFGMFALETASMALREIARHVRAGGDSQSSTPPSQSGDVGSSFQTTHLPSCSLQRSAGKI